MPTIPLKDGFGLDVSVSPGPGALLKYFKNLPAFRVNKFNLSNIASTTLAEATGDLSFTTGLSFDQPVEIGSGVELTLNPSVDATLALFVPAKDGALLFSPDLYGDNIPVKKDQRYVSLGMRAAIEPSAAGQTHDLSFGFNGQAAVDFTYYQRFPADDTPVLEAVEGAIANFAIPADLDDIAAMREGSIATVQGCGSLTFSGSVNLLAVTNPLAAASLPVAGSLCVTAGATISVGASYTFSGNYQVRVERLARDTFRLGFYRQRETDFSISASANGSLSATIGSTDLVAKLIHAISADPEADLKALSQAGLPAGQIHAIQTAVSSAVDRSLAIGAALELSSSDVSEAMFLYLVDLSAVQDNSRALLHAALEGKLDQLLVANAKLPAGIQVLKTLVSETKTFRHSLKINLLGIYNFLNVSSLIQKGAAAWDATTGELILTDQITASKISVSTANLQADTRKLRKVLAQQFLVTAAYRAVGNVLTNGVSVTAQQSYFESEQRASALQIRNDLLTASALGLRSPEDALRAMPQHVSQFGPEIVYAEASYSDSAFRSLFIRDGELRDFNEYLNAGRAAITLLVQPGDPDAFRLIPATNPDLFQKLMANGNPQSIEFQQLLIASGVPQAKVLVAGVDFVNIVWLATALSQTGIKLLAMDHLQSANPGSHDFLKLKRELADHLASVTERATDDFGGPWGFNTMALLNSSSHRKWFLSNAHISGVLESAQTSAAQA